MKVWPCVLIVSVAVKLVLTTGLTTKSILQHVNGTLKRKLPLEFTLQTIRPVSPHTASRQGKIFPISNQVAGESSQKMPLRSKPPLSSLLVNASIRNNPSTSTNSTLRPISVNALKRNTPSTSANSTQRSRRGWPSSFSTVLHDTTFVTKHGGAITSRFSSDDTTNTGFVKDRLKGQQNTPTSTIDAGTSDGSSKINRRTGPPTSQHPHRTFPSQTESNPGYTNTSSWLHIDTKFVMNCLKTQSVVALPSLDGQLVLVIDEQQMLKEVNDNFPCHMYFTPPPGQVMLIEFEKAPRLFGYENVFSVTESPGNELPQEFSRSKVVSMDTFTQHAWNRRAYTFPGLTVWFHVEMNKDPIPIFPVVFNFTWVNETRLPGLEAVFTSPNAGLVQTQDFDGQTLFQFNTKDTWVQVDVPFDSWIMFSLVHISCHVNVDIDIYFGYLSWPLDVCSDSVDGPGIRKTDMMYVHFKTTLRSGWNDLVTKGFQLLFSFHPDSKAPRKSSDVRYWNCSSGQWPQYQQHFRCNLQPDCVDGRDEDNCPYSSPECRRGMIAVGHKCCFIMPGDHESELTWDIATENCRRGRGQLVSLNGPEEWRNLELLATHVDHLMIGLRTTNNTLPHVYRHTWQHADGTIAYYIGAPIPPEYTSRSCGALEFDSSRRMSLGVFDCDSFFDADVLCERLWSTGRTTSVPEQRVTLAPLESSPSSPTNSLKFVVCSRGHLTHSFLSCDQQSACFEQRSTSCSGVMTPHSPSLPCANGLDSVTFTFVCDFRPDCSDNSDEDFCHYLPCDLNLHFQCSNGQCVNKQAVCNGVKDCHDGSDEDYCLTDDRFSMNHEPWPVVVQLDAFRGVRLVPLNSSYSTNRSLDCPPAHFQCPGSGYCLPVFTRCNGVYDCQGRQDEADCNQYTCPGYYRCRASAVCLTPAEMCDGVFHCPQYDDELLCDSVCPPGCTCYGHAFFCGGPFQAGQFAELRYLHASGSGLRPSDVSNNTMLVYLNLASCALRELSHLSLSNLHILHLSDNHLTKVSDEHLFHLPNLRHLSLAGNPLTSIFRKQGVNLVQSTRLHTLDLSRVTIPVFHMSALSPFPNIRVLNLTDCEVDTLSTDRFKTPASLHVLDVRGCPLTYFPRDLLQGQKQLLEVLADNYKLCCPINLPSDFNLADCRAPRDEVSSCDNLLRSHVYRVFLALFAALALLGNLTPFVVRGIIGKVNNGFDIFTVALCVSDFLMGVYLAIIGVADRLYLGSYLWNDVSWRRSATCKVAGFLCMTSNEVSALVVCLITLDRLLVLRFPFSQVRFSKKSGALASGLVWVVGVVLALIPLLPPTAHWGFYSLNGICMPLPITRNEFPGHSYSFSLLIVFNFVLFMLIAVGQLLIYLSVQKNSLRNSDNDTKRSSKDQRLARRLITVAMSDFLCWFPIGLLGIVSSAGQPVSGEVNVAMAIFVLPLNSAINPFLYTVNRLLEKRQMEKEKRLIELITALSKNRLQ